MAGIGPMASCPTCPSTSEGDCSVIATITIPAGRGDAGMAAYQVLLESTGDRLLTLSCSCMRSPLQIVLEVPSVISRKRIELLR